MKSFQSDLYYKSLDPRRIIRQKAPAVILLHGRGADENDLFGLSEYFDDRLAVFSVRAPYPFEYGGYTYFRLLDDNSAEPVMFMESYKRLMKFADDVSVMPEVDPKKIFLLGFSMGTIMAYAMSLTHPEKFAGVIAQSGFVRDHPQLRFQWNALDHCPFIITHGMYDPVIPIDAARTTREMFFQSNAKFEYKEYPMGHEISGESLSDVCGWMKTLLG